VTVSGIDRIAEAFASARANGARAALIPYLMGGFPDLDISCEIGLAYARSGADLVELGVPFSDPLADGPVIHAAGTAALRAGAKLPGVLEVARTLAGSVPVVVMCYSNVIFARGVERFADALLQASVSGLIVPDLPLEEAQDMFAACEARSLALVPLVAPTTPEERLARIGARARGFLYTLAVTGTTGERAGSPASVAAARPSKPDNQAPDSERATGPAAGGLAPLGVRASPAAGGLAALVERAAAHTQVPVAIGFGIGTPEQAADAAGAGADGVIVGSRLVRAAGEAEDPVKAVAELVRDFSIALLPRG
jgi:tryptophan synthase alpha chain